MFRVSWLNGASDATGQNGVVAEEAIVLQNATSLRDAIEESVELWHEPKYSRMDGFTIIRDGKAVYRSPKKSF